MCVVTALAALPSALTGLGGLMVSAGTIAADVALGLGVASMFQQSKATNYQAQSAQNQQVAQNRAIEYQAQIQDNNAEIMEMQAQDAEARGESEETDLRRKVSRLKGAQRAKYGASGVVTDAGSPLDALLDTTAEEERDALTIRHNAAMEAWGHRVSAADTRSQANLTRYRKVDPDIPYQTTLLSGKSKMYDRAGGLVSSTARFAGL